MLKTGNDIFVKYVRYVSSRQSGRVSGMSGPPVTPDKNHGVDDKMDKLDSIHEKVEPFLVVSITVHKVLHLSRISV